MIHSVYFWLRDDVTDEESATFAREIDSLISIDLIQRATVGTPAPTAERPVTDHSWHTSLILEFANLADHNAYQVHPNHDVFVDRCKHLWAKALVLDTQPR